MQKPEAFVELPKEKITQRLKEEDAKVLRRSPASPLEYYAQSVVRDREWRIREQPTKALPRSLTDLISLALRDEGNALIEETRVLNRRFIGQPIVAAKAESILDADVLYLRRRLLEWAEARGGPVRSDSFLDF